VAAREVLSGALVARWLEGRRSARPLFQPADDVLVVGYFLPAEWSCYLELGWRLPSRCLDLYAEFRNATSGLPVPSGSGLLGALLYHGLEAMGGAEKEAYRDLAIRGGPFTDRERDDLLRYCAADVDATARLLEAMAPRIDLSRALLRGRYTQAVARMERRGIPLDVPALDAMRASWDHVKAHVIREVNRNYGVFVPADPRQPDGPLSFSERRWSESPVGLPRSSTARPPTTRKPSRGQAPETPRAGSWRSRLAPDRSFSPPTSGPKGGPLHGPQEQFTRRRRV
jgi:hypothetical protein